MRLGHLIFFQLVLGSVVFCLEAFVYLFVLLLFFFQDRWPGCHLIPCVVKDGPQLLICLCLNAGITGVPLHLGIKLRASWVSTLSTQSYGQPIASFLTLTALMLGSFHGNTECNLRGGCQNDSAVFFWATLGKGSLD